MVFRVKLLGEVAQRRCGQTTRARTGNPAFASAASRVRRLAQSVQPPDASASQGVPPQGARGDARVRQVVPRRPSAGHGCSSASTPRGVPVPRGSQPPAGHLPRPEGAEDADLCRVPRDPEVPDEEEEEEERKKNPGEPGTNPDEDEDEENPQPKKKEEEDE